MYKIKILIKYPQLTVFIRSLYDIEGNTVGDVVRWMDSNPVKLKEMIASL
tara:strand:+ start:699 stop:848 length:150 start_codon:yes stop_codon:yes gene_type:complete